LNLDSDGLFDVYYHVT